jgi:hypothetical protein
MGDLHEKVPRLRRRYVPRKNSLRAVKFIVFVMDHKWTGNPEARAALIKIVAGAPRRPIKKSPTSLSGAKEGQSARGLSFRAAWTTRESHHGSGSTQRVESDSEADA